MKLALRSPVVQSVILVSTDDARETALRSNRACKVLNDRSKAVRFCKEVSSNSVLNLSMTSSSAEKPLFVFLRNGDRERARSGMVVDEAGPLVIVNL